MAGNASTFDRNEYLGSPLSIQVVAPRLQERQLYEAMRAIDDAVHSRRGEAKL